MKTKMISHGSRYLRSWGKRHYRELKHSDDETLSRGREQDRDLEPDEWPWLPPCRCCDFSYGFDEKLRVMFLGSQPLPLSVALPDDLQSETDLVDSEEGQEVEDTDAFLDHLQAHLERIQCSDCDPSEVISCSAEELTRLNAFMESQRWRTTWHTLTAIMTKVLALEPFWLRSPVTWNPQAAGEAYESLESLLRHLFARQPVPLILLLDEAWSSFEWKWQIWVLLMGRGLSVRRAGVRFGWWSHSKLIENLFEAPCFRMANYPEFGCQWADARRRGASPQTAMQLLEYGPFQHDPTAPLQHEERFYTSEINLPEGRSFYLGTLEWLVRYQDHLPEERMHDIFQWSRHLRTEQQRRNQTAFSWKGRTAASVLRDVDEYEAELRAAREAAMQAQTGQAWQGHGANWEKTLESGTTWSAVELTSHAELVEEGSQLHHCVALYAALCMVGECAIFSIRRNNSRVLTVEIKMPDWSVKQARGSCNRSASAEEELVVQEWLSNVPNPLSQTWE